MSDALKQLSVAFGGVLFIAVMVLALTSRVPVLVAVFRAFVVMCIGSVVVALFFRFFTVLLYRFVTEQVLKHRQEATQAEGDSKDSRFLSPEAE